MKRSITTPPAATTQPTVINALQNNTIGVYNTATGFTALYSNTSGHDNTAMGFDALLNNTTGSFNTAIGDSALDLNTTGGGNIALGDLAGSNVTTANNVICIGAHGNNVSNSCYSDNIFGATSSGGTAVFVNGAGRLGTATSSRRFKEEIKPMDKASEALLALKPVTFRYKKEIDPSGQSAVWPGGRGSGKGESRSGGARQRRKALQRALRGGERDVAQRVPQRAS